MNKRQLNAISRATLMLQVQNQLASEKITKLKSTVSDMKVQIDNLTDKNIKFEENMGLIETRLLNMLANSDVYCACANNTSSCTDRVCRLVLDRKLRDLKAENTSDSSDSE